MMFCRHVRKALVIASLVISLGVNAGPSVNPLWHIKDAITAGVSAGFEINNYLPYDITVNMEVQPSYIEGVFTNVHIPANSDMTPTVIKQKFDFNVPQWVLTAVNTAQKFSSRNLMSLGGTLKETTYQEGKSNKPGQTGIMISPVNQDGGRRWAYYGLFGLGNLPALANSAINANIKALRLWIRNTHPVVNATDGLQIAITDIPDLANVQFAAVRPIGQPSDKKYSLAAVIDVTGKAEAMIRFQISGDTWGLDVATVDLSTFSMMVIVEIDLSGALPVIKIKGLQTSARGLTIVTKAAREIGLAFGIAFPVLRQFLDINDPVALALVNSDYNTKIIDTVNSAIADEIAKKFKPKRKRDLEALIESLMPPAGDLAATDSETRNTPPANPKIRARQHTLTPQSSWMSTPAMQAKTMKTLKVPGTHDSATNALKSELSLIKYDDIKFLWQLDFSGQSAPGDGTNPFDDGKKYYLGTALGSYVLERIKKIATAQEGSIQTQLLDGVRWFDLRLYFDPATNEIFSQHGLKGSNIVEIFQEINAFFKAIPENSAELVMLQVSHTNFGDYDLARTKFQSLVGSSFGSDKIYMPPNSKNVSSFDFQTLADLTLGSITGGKNKIMIMNSDNFTFPDLIVNTQGYASKKAANDQTPGLWSVSNVITPGTSLVIESIVGALTGKDEYLLKTLAEQTNTNSNMVKKLFTENGGNFNLVTFDWYKYPQESPRLPPVDLIISLNVDIPLPPFPLPQPGGDDPLSVHLPPPRPRVI